MPQPPRDDQKIDNAYAFGLLCFVLYSHRLCITVFTRHSFGTNAFHLFGVGAFFALLLASGAFPGFGLYFVAWCVVLIGQRIQSYRLRWKGVVCHSRYPGYPWLAMRLPFVNGEPAARMAEPLICVAAGLLVLTFNQFVGTFILAGAVSLVACMAIDAIIERRRVQAMNDAEIEMSFYVQRYRQGG